MTISSLILAASTEVANSSEASDAYFGNTMLLLKASGTNGANNSFFVDSSPNNFTTSRTGNVTQGSFSPFSKEFDRWGVFIPNGNADYLTIPGNTSFAFGTGDFTIECWICKTSPTTGLGDFIICENDNSGLSWYVSIYNGKISVGSTNAYPYLQGTSTIQLNVWYHIAVTRAGGVVRVFLNGVKEGEAVNNTNYTATPPLTIGSNRPLDSNWPYYGFISNLRVIKGNALYTTSFTPSLNPLAATLGTSLLCCQANQFKDNSTNNFSVATYGNVKIVADSPFASISGYSPGINGGSGYFDGSGDYLTVPAGTTFSFSGDFTIECWVYPQRVASGSSERNLYILGTYFGLNLDPGVKVLAYLTNTSFFTVTDVVPKYDEWSHIAFVRSSGVARLFVNGKVSNSTLSNSSTVGDSTVPFPVGALPSQANTYGYKGYISDFRIVKGTALYLNSFTPPSAPLTAVANTALLFKFTNAGINDFCKKHVFETIGGSQVSTAQKKFGTGAMAFDGSGDYLQASHTTEHLFGAGDFTIEGWLYKNNNSTSQTVVAKWSTGGWGVIFYTVAGLDKISFMYGTGTVIANDVDSFPTNQWIHFAITRSSSTVRIFVNGTQKASAGDSNNYNSTEPLWVGGLGANYAFDGFIDELRITRGIARYTTSFTVPTQTLPSK